MKKRVLFSACALAVCFAACTNDDFETVKNNNVIANGEENSVVGADLVSKGMKTSFEQEGVATRALNGEWQVGDRAGLAWFNFMGEGHDIEEVQDINSWTNGNYNTIWGNPDLNIYANHFFEYKEDGKWQAYSDVYQGAYFGYWPYSALHGVKSKEVHPNNTVQTKTFAQDLADNTFYLSAQDFVAVGDVDENTMILNKAFPIFPMVNAVGVRATPSDEIVNAENDYLRNMVITKMTINAGGTNNDVFRTGGTLVPSRIPKAIDEDGEYYGNDDLRDVMDGAAEAATSANYAILATNGLAEATNSLVTTIKSDNYNLGDAKGTVKVDTLRAFAFPIQKGVEYTTTQYPDVVITVSTPVKDAQKEYKWELGKFAVNHDNSADLIETLKDLLSAGNASNANTWVKNILRNPNTDEYTVPRSGSMTANLKVNDFTPTTNAITCEDQWNDLVALVQALDDAGKNNFQKTTGENAYEYVEFTLANDVTLNDEIKVPADVKIQLNTGSHTLTIDGEEVDWPVNLVVDNTDKIKVAVGTHLYVGAEGHAAAGEEIVLDADITNNGTIHVGSKASINTSGSTNKLTNNKEVIVEYGAYVYPDADAVGIIAFEVKNNEEETMGYINTLIQTVENNQIDTQKYFAYVNRLIIGTEENVVELDLNAKATSANDDRYNPVDATYLLGLNLIDIVLTNGSVVYDPETAKLRNDSKDLKNVKNVISRGEGTVNTITDIQPLGDITIEKGSQLSIESEIAIPLTDDGTPLKLNDNATIKNEGTLYVNNTVTTKDFINAIGTAYVQRGVDFYDEYIYYTNDYQQGGLTSGSVVEIAAEGTTYEELSDKAKAVQDTFIDFVTNPTVNATSFEEVAAWWEDNKASASGDWVSAKFYDAMSAWLTSVELPALPTTYSEGDLSVALLTQFETVTGYELQFTK